MAGTSFFVSTATAKYFTTAGTPATLEAQSPVSAAAASNLLDKRLKLSTGTGLKSYSVSTGQDIADHPLGHSDAGQTLVIKFVDDAGKGDSLEIPNASVSYKIANGLGKAVITGDVDAYVQAYAAATNKTLTTTDAFYKAT